MEKIGKFRYIGVIAVAIMLMLTLSACGGDSGGATSGKSNADLLKDAAANMKAAKSYHLLVNASQAGQEVKIDGDIDMGNNKSKLAMAAAGQNINVISIGSDTYASTDGGKTFTKTPAGTDMGMGNFTKLWDNFKPEEIDKAKDALKDGSPKDETLGSDATRHMTANTKDLASLAPSGSSGTTDGTIDMWVTTGSTPTVRKMQIKGTDKGAEVNATLEWTDINKSFAIDAPPVTAP
jgi:hypothetical protein